MYSKEISDLYELNLKAKQYYDIINTDEAREKVKEIFKEFNTKLNIAVDKINEISDSIERRKEIGDTLPIVFKFIGLKKIFYKTFGEDFELDFEKYNKLKDEYFNHQKK